MKSTNRIIAILFSLAGLIYILLDYTDLEIARHVLKGTLIPFLIILFLISVKGEMKGTNLFLLGGLVFSWAGDIALDFAFIPGLACFLMAHLMYISAFLLIPGKNTVFLEKLYLLIPVAAFGVALIFLLYGSLGVMKLPVIVYAIVILIMVVAAMNRLGKVTSQSYRIVLAGAILFVISDSAIAINKFKWDFDFSGPVIMSTYLAAQYLIVTGYLKGRRI